MRILLVTGHPYLPQIRGGAQSSMDEIARALQARGHHVGVVSGMLHGGMISLRARIAMRLGRDFHVDRGLGYPVFRSWLPWEAGGSVVECFRPDVVIVQSGWPARMARAFASQGVKVVVHFRNVEDDDLEDFTSADGHDFISNSHFTAERVADRYGVKSTVIVPSFDAGRYAVEQRGNLVTFINPHPKKGLDLMLKVVERLPERQFLFVKAWTLAQDLNDELAAASSRLRNLTVEEAVDDVRSIYRRTKLLVLPSLWEEAFGRVATEAHFSGIPVVGVDRGGIAEAVGPGGIVLPSKAGVTEWAATINALLNDEVHYDELSRAALRYAQRPEINVVAQAAEFERICANLVGFSTSGR